MRGPGLGFGLQVVTDMNTAQRDRGRTGRERMEQGRGVETAAEPDRQARGAIRRRGQSVGQRREPVVHPTSLKSPNAIQRL